MADGGDQQSPAIDFAAIFAVARAPMLLIAADAPRFTVLDVNSAYLQATWKTREALVGRGILEAFPANPGEPGASGPTNMRASLDAVITRRAADPIEPQKYDIRRPDGEFEARWWQGVNTPLVGAEGRVEAILHQVEDVTAAMVRDRDTAAAAFRRRLDDRLRALVDPGAIMLAAAETLARRLNAGRVGYGELESDDTHVRVERDWSEGAMPSLAGRFRLDDFGSRLIAALRSGRSCAIVDVSTDPATALDGAAAAHKAIGVSASLNVPLVKEGRLTAVLFAHSPEPRRWSDEDVALAEEVAERAWSALQRARAENRLHDNEARLRLVQQVGGVGSFDYDVGSGRIFRSAEYLEIHGLPKDGQLEAQFTDSWRERLHPEDRARVEAAFAADMAHPASFDLEYRIRRADTGETRWIANRGEVIGDAEGRATRLISAQSDITERKAREAAFAESERDLRTAIEAGRFGTWSLDLATGELKTSRTCRINFGRAADEPMSYEELRDAVHPDDKARMAAAVEASIATGGDYDIEYRIVTPASEERWVYIRAKPIRAPGGAVMSMSGISLDITERKRGEAAFRESEERFRLIANSAPVPIWVTKLDRTRGFVNDAYRAFVGTSYEEALTFDWRAIIHPDDMPRLLAESIAGEASGRPFTLLGRYRDAAGEWRWLESTSQPRRDAEGALTGFIGVAHDVTEAKQAEARLRASADELRLVTDSLPVLVSYIDAGYRYRFANRAYQEWFGQPVDAILGRSMADVLGIAAFARVKDKVDRALAGETFSFDAMLPYKSGGARDVHVQYTPHIVEGHVAGFYAMVQDVSERVAAEHAERKHYAEREAILEQLGEGVIVTDARGRITYANRAAAALHGVARIDPSPGWYDATFTLADEDGEPFAPARLPLTRAYRDGVASLGIRWRIGRPDGRELVVLGSAQPVIGPGGGLVGAVLTFSDDTERVAAEAELERQVAEAIAERMKAEESLRQAQKMEAIGKLTGGIAHDFNNLLTVILSSADLLKRPDIATDKRDRYIAAIAETAQRAAALTSQLLAFARRQPLASEAFDAGASVRALRPMLGTMLGEGVRLTVKANPGQVIKADPSQFESAIVNMAVNARDAMPGGGRLTIAVAAGDADHVAVTVADTGQGIDPDKLQAIFEPFYTTKAIGKGTGLGLSQVYGFAKQSNGRIDVTSEPGRGTIFTLTLPRGELAPQTRAPKAEPDCAAPDRPCRVLVVEDNRAVGEFAARLLDDMGHQVTLETEGAAALARIEANEAFDLVFSDVIMPGALDGLALARKLRTDHPALPVILTTGYAQGLAEDAAHGFEILRKPYSADALAALIAKAVRQ